MNSKLVAPTMCSLILEGTYVFMQQVNVMNIHYHLLIAAAVGYDENEYSILIC